MVDVPGIHVACGQRMRVIDACLCSFTRIIDKGPRVWGDLGNIPPPPLSIHSQAGPPVPPANAQMYRELSVRAPSGSWQCILARTTPAPHPPRCNHAHTPLSTMTPFNRFSCDDRMPTHASWKLTFRNRSRTMDRMEPCGGAGMLTMCVFVSLSPCSSPRTHGWDKGGVEGLYGRKKSQ